MNFISVDILFNESISCSLVAFIVIVVAGMGLHLLHSYAAPMVAVLSTSTVELATLLNNDDGDGGFATAPGASTAEELPEDVYARLPGDDPDGSVDEETRVVVESRC